jgi:hypothetical protein
MIAPPFLQRFERVTPAGDEKWRASCPHCGGKRAISVGAGDDRWLVYCHAGCRAVDLLAHVGLRTDDLFYEAERHQVGGNASTAHSLVPLFPCTTVQEGNSETRELPEFEQLLQAHAEGHLGVVEPVELPPLPDDATVPMRRVAELYATAVGLRAWAGRPDALDAPFACRWVAAKLGLPHMTAWRALRGLVEAGVLEQGETLPGRGGKRGTQTYRPGVKAAPLAGAGHHQIGDLLVVKPAVERDAPHVEQLAVQERDEPEDVVRVLEAPAGVVGGVGAPVGGAAAGMGIGGHEVENTPAAVGYRPARRPRREPQSDPASRRAGYLP